MNYCKIRKMDISNGPGVRVSIFVQGCTFNCPNCFNKETHDFEGGKPFNQETIDHILKLCEQSHIQGLSILGGEPLHPRNIDAVIELCKAFNAHFNNAKSIWVWTGYLYENIVNKDIYNHVDVIVDGKYVDELHDFRLKWRGSSNQRVIDVKETIKNNNITLFCD